MRKETARRLMMARLFGEITPEEDARLTRYLNEHEDAAHEWEQVRETHLLLASLKNHPVPSHLESSIHSMAHSMEEKQPRSGRKWARPFSIISTTVAAAACLLLYIYVPVETNRQQESQLSAEKNEAPTLMEPKEQQDTFAFDDHKRSSKKKEEPITSTSTIPSQTRSHTITATSLNQENDRSRNDIEKLFRTGLTLYNTAFTKVGEERTAMLKSAVVFLQDLEKRASDQSKWISLSLILLADSYRALGDIPAAIQTYQRMIETFPTMETYVKQARLSIVKLLVEHSDDLALMEAALEQFTSVYPQNSEIVEAAFTFAEKVEPNNPEQSLKWYRRLAEQFKEEQILYEKIHQKSSTVQENLEDRMYIKDWWILGPMDLHYLPVGEEDLNENHFYNTNKSFRGLNQSQVQWERPYKNESGIVELAPLLNPLPHRCSAFAFTYLFSEHKREVLLSGGANCGLRIRVNNQPVLANVNTPQNFKKDQYKISVMLNKGWNPVLVKFFLHEQRDWKFAMTMRDPEGYLLTDIIAHPNKKHTSESLNNPTSTPVPAEDILRVEFHKNRDR